MDVKTVSLIGMPGAGKSTIGVLLAKRLGLNFIDTDLLIQVQRGEPLQDSVDKLGFEAFCALEESVLLAAQIECALVATGGSVVYSDRAMARLGAAGPVVYLDVPLPVLSERVRAQPDRGIAFTPGHTLEDIYRKRKPLYERFADIAVACNALSPEAIAAEITCLLDTE
jgi:shikimate kinase